MSNPADTLAEGARGGAPDFMRDDLPHLRKAFMFAGISLGLSVLFGLGSLFLQDWQAAQKQEAMQARAAAQAKLQEVENEKRAILDSQPEYIKLRKQNIVGEENRLEWIDAVRQIQNEHNFLPVSYEILPQQTLPADPALNLANLELRGSRMGLNMKLLHEMDLYVFLQQLRAQHFFLPLACNIQRIGPTQDNPQPTGMAADCTLLFITMKEKGGP
ncbi:hypothetical protein V8J88_09565 [Massilia sp. W12]|uniref:hypothetical protein n=1 Tax=Massilia sp. W12 TaxID=3126507 RepID=UPI0030D40657